MTPPPGSSGGLLNAFYGSAVMILLALAIGTPVGIAAGTYLAEHGRHSRLAATVSFINDILLSAPSIVIGLFVYELVVRPCRPFLRLRRRARAGDDPAADRRPDHRRVAAPGARTRCARRPSRSACRAGG